MEETEVVQSVESVVNFIEEDIPTERWEGDFVEQANPDKVKQWLKAQVRTHLLENHSRQALKIVDEINFDIEIADDTIDIEVKVRDQKATEFLKEE